MLLGENEMSTSLPKFSSKLLIADEQCMEAFFGEPFQSVCAPMLSSIRSDGGIAFLVGGKQKIRTTVIATCLLTLADMGLLERETICRMQKKLLELRDHMDADDEKRGDYGVSKKPEDASAWCVGETSSVWSTSFALWSLLRTGYQNEDIKPIISGLVWLIDQQNPSNAWGYQRFRNCRDNTMMTVLAILALREAQKRSDEIGLEVEFGRQVDTAIERGVGQRNQARFIMIMGFIPRMNARQMV